MKKIAIIGSSPLMMMLALALKKKGHSVVIFENLINRGGAWTFFKDYLKKYDLLLPKYTNAIHPYSKREENFIPLMNFFLKKNFKVNIKKSKKSFKVNYPVKQAYIYNFKNFFKIFTKKLIFKRYFVNSIKVEKNKKIKIENKIFDKVFVPSFCGVKKIIFKNKIKFLNYKKITSEHILIISKKFNLKKNFLYSMKFDHNIDRVQVLNHGRFLSLTARLSYPLKGSNLKKLKNIFVNKLYDKKDLICFRLSKYKNYYRDNVQLKNMKSVLKNTNIEYVDTTQFLIGYFLLRKHLNFKIK